MSFSAEAQAWADNKVRLNLQGRLDSATCAGFEQQLLGLLEPKGAAVVVDCTALDYVASAGLRVILMGAKRARQNEGQMVLCGLQPQVREVLEISGFLKILSVAPDFAAAQAGL